MTGKKIQNIIFEIFKYVSLILAAIVALVPIVVCITTAFKTNEEYANTSVLQLPKSFAYLDNFKIAIEKANMLRCFANTAIILVVVLLASATRFISI